MREIKGFICDGCGVLHKDKKDIYQCKECGNEICEECSAFDEEYCDDCYEELYCDEDEGLPKSLWQDMIICNPDLV